MTWLTLRCSQPGDRLRYVIPRTFPRKWTPWLPGLVTEVSGTANAQQSTANQEKVRP